MSEDQPELDEPKTERFNMFMSPSEMQAIDEWAWKHRVRSKSEAVRRLVKMALTFDAARHGFSDSMVARGEAGSAVFEMAMAHVWQEIRDDPGSPKTAELLSAVKKFQEAEDAFMATLRSMFDELNFLKFANDPFVDAEKRAEEKAKVLAALNDALGITASEPNE